MIPVTLLALGLGLVTSTPASAQVQRFPKIPEAGLILQGGTELQPVRIGTGYRLLPSGEQAVLTPWEQLQARPPKHVFRLDRQRRHERDKELGRRQGGSLLRGVLTEVLYKKQRKKAERR